MKKIIVGILSVCFVAGCVAYAPGSYYPAPYYGYAGGPAYETWPYFGLYGGYYGLYGGYYGMHGGRYIGGPGPLRGEGRAAGNGRGGNGGRR